MKQLIAIKSPDEQEQWSRPGSLAPFDPEDLARHACDEHWTLVNNNGEPVGRCSLWWRHAPSLPGYRLGIIGHYAVRDAEAARALLQHACEQLTAHGCTMAVGPMDGNTWRRYRLITERGSEPVFFLEPDNPDDWPGHFYGAGFAPLAHFSSAINTELAREDPRMQEVGDRLTTRGVRIRPLNLQRLEDDVHHLYTLSRLSFQDNLLFMPIEEAEFIAQYRHILPRVRPEMVLIAEHLERPIGFVFAVPDLLQAGRGGEIDTVILKTVAVMPECAGAGLGSLLMARVHEIARQLGYTRVIHALMHETNNSLKISRHSAKTIRRYTLFARPLGEQP
jgi:GNAT superfamily N-acetyltransferase